MKRVLVLCCVVVWSTGAGFGQSGKKVSSVTHQLSPARLNRISASVITQESLKKDAEDHLAKLNADGPSLPALPLGALVRVEQMDLFSGVGLQDLCRWSLKVYPDANPDANVYYYRPTRYVLRFDRDEGYFLSLDYKAGQGGEDNVLMQARLTPGAGPTDRSVLEALLAEYTGHGEAELLPLPAVYEADFDLSNWDVDEVTINGIDPDTGEIVLTLLADVPTKELVTSSLGNVNGLVGNVTMTPLTISDSQTLHGPIHLQAEIRLGDAWGGPPMLWSSATSSHAELTNRWPFDLRVHYLVYLLEEPGSGLRLRGWNLGDAQLGPGDTARLPVDDLNDEIDAGDVITARYIASPVRDDQAVRDVVEGLTGGVGALPVQRLTIDVVGGDDLFTQYGLYKLAVEVQSAHFDPKGREVETRTYSVTGSSEEVTTDPLYLWEDSSDLFRYRVGIVTSDGVVHSDTTWRQPSSMLPHTIMIGSRLVEEVLAE